jgi:preprotein translocase subunit SecE
VSETNMEEFGHGDDLTPVATSARGGSRDDGRGDRKAGRVRGFFARIALFVRQVIVELKRVIWPTRKELATYTWVVIVFVTVLTLIVFALDLLFGKLVLRVFG